MNEVFTTPSVTIECTTRVGCGELVRAFLENEWFCFERVVRLTSLAGLDNYLVSSHVPLFSRQWLAERGYLYPLGFCCTVGCTVFVRQKTLRIRLKRERVFKKM